jgi:hypothetical protein
MIDALRWIVRIVLQLLAGLPESAQLLGFLLFALFVLWLVGFKVARWLLPRLAQFLSALVERLLACLLFPEYLATSALRRRGRRPLGFVYLVGDGCQTLARELDSCATGLSGFFEKRWRVTPRAAVLLLCVVTALVLIRPSVEETPLAKLTTFWNEKWRAIQTWSREGTESQ